MVSKPQQTTLTPRTPHSFPATCREAACPQRTRWAERLVSLGFEEREDSVHPLFRGDAPVPDRDVRAEQGGTGQGDSSPRAKPQSCGLWTGQPTLEGLRAHKGTAARDPCPPAQPLHAGRRTWRRPSPVRGARTHPLSGTGRSRVSLQDKADGHLRSPPPSVQTATLGR